MVVRNARRWCILSAQRKSVAACKRGDAAGARIGMNLAYSIIERERSGAPDATHHNPEMDD
jgi:hypothetical protein